jgi:hypothetical protein
MLVASAMAAPPRPEWAANQAPKPCSARAAQGAASQLSGHEAL